MNIIYFYLKQGNRKINEILKDTRKSLISLIIIMGMIFISMKFSSIFFTVFLTALGALSLIHNRFFKYSNYIGFELCTMATVLCSIAYGPMHGAFAGFTSLFTGFILSGNFRATYYISILVLPLIGFLVPFFTRTVFGDNLLMLGIFMTALYDAIILPLYYILGSSRIITKIIFFVTHILLNAWVFSTLAPLILRLMT